MRLFKWFSLPILILSVLVYANFAYAQEQKPGSGLSIQPLHSRFNLDPGQASTLTVTIKNITSGPIVAKPKINDFKADNISGSPVIITDPKVKLPTTIKGFVGGLQDVPLAKGEQKNVTLSIDIPEGQSPGAYYGIVRYIAIPQNPAQVKENEVSLSASVGTIVLIQVKGDLVQKISLQDVNIYQNKSEGAFFTKKPTDVGVLMNNFGNSFVQPFGRVAIQNTSGHPVYSYEFNGTDPRGTVLPNSSREFKDPIKNIGSPGRYTVSASISYGDGSDVLVLERHFWYVPLWLIITVIGVIILLVLLTIVLIRRRRHGRRRLKKLHK